MKKLVVLCVLLLISLSIVDCSKAKAKAKSKSKSKRKAGAKEDPPPPPEDSKEPKEFVDVDRIQLLVPKVPPAIATKPQIVIQRDKVHASENYHEDLKMEEKCKLKQSYLVKEMSIQKGASPVMFAVPSFAVLNQNSLSFFDNENVHSLIAAYPLKDIIVDDSDYLWAQINCFQIFRNEPNANGEPKKGKRLTNACAETKTDMDKWIEAIREFHKCEVAEIEESSTSQAELKMKKRRSKLESDEELEERRVEQKEEEEHDLSKLVNTDIDAENLQMDGLSKEIMEEFKRQKELERKRKAKLIAERKMLIEKNKKYGAQARCIENALEIKAVEDEKSLEMMLSEEKAIKEKNLMADAYQKLKNIWKNENEEIDSQEMELNRAQTEIASKLKHEMIQETADWTKNLDPAECYDDSLTGGAPTALKNVCASLIDYGASPDLKMLLRCLDRKYFCDECCNYYIGVTHEEDRVKCKERCNQVVNDEANLYKVQYGIGQPRTIVASAGGNAPTNPGTQ